MKIRVTVLSILKVAVFGGAGALAGCGGGAGGKLLVDTPVLPYQAPDISDITGIEEPDTDDADTTPAVPAAAAKPAAATPATPATPASGAAGKK